MEEYDENGADRNSIHIYITLHYITLDFQILHLRYITSTLHCMALHLHTLQLRYVTHIILHLQTGHLHYIAFHSMALHYITLHIYIYIYTTFTLH